MKIGIDIGGSHIALGLVNDNNQITDIIDNVWKKKKKKDVFSTIMTNTNKYIEELINRNSISISSIEKIGIGFPYRNIRDGIIYLEDREIDLPQIISKNFNLPVYLKNDVKCSSLCEKNIGNLRNYENALFLTLGTGIGGAFYYKNELIVPNTYQGMEIGHMVIEVNGKKCRCGKNGCFEEYASMRAFRNRIREIYNIEDVNSSIALDLFHKKEKEQEMNEAINKYIGYLSIGLSNLISILEPDAICIGGSFVHYEEMFLDKLKKVLHEELTGRAVPEILLAEYENNAGIIGATMLTCN